MIILNTPHGIRELENYETDISVDKYLKAIGIPYNSVSLYTQNELGEWVNYVGIDQSIESILKLNDKLMIRSDKNIDLIKMITPDKIIEESKSTDTSEYIFDNLGVNSKQIHKKFTAKESKSFVKEKVKKFLEDSDIDFNKPLVFGISGGGDSNTLQQAFIDNGFPKENIIPVMIKGIPDIDKGLPRAKIITEQHGLELIEVEPETIDKLLGRSKKDGSWAEDFEKYYPGGDLEMIGTLAVRLGLMHIKELYNAQGCVTGLNLEDILSEGILSIMQGEIPPKYPERLIGDTKFYYPLYQVPKKILDGCHPKLSLENYEQRFPNRLYWRTLTYHVAQSISTTVPGSEYRLLEGIKNISDKYFDQDTYVFDEEIGFVVERGVDDETRELWKQFIQGK